MSSFLASNSKHVKLLPVMNTYSTFLWTPIPDRASSSFTRKQPSSPITAVITYNDKLDTNRETIFEASTHCINKLLFALLVELGWLASYPLQLVHCIRNFIYQLIWTKASWGDIFVGHSFKTKVIHHRLVIPVCKCLVYLIWHYVRIRNHFLQQTNL